LPVFRTKKEPFEWLIMGRKTIDVRKGNAIQGDVAVYICGREILKMKIVKQETGALREVIREDNFRRIIPMAVNLEDAVSYLSGLYSGSDGFFTAYYVVPLEG
jgi:ASC-1-like (ASCH) protein